MRKALLGVALALWLAPPAHAAAPSRLLYASDWNGRTQIFAADPASGRTVGQITFGRSAPECGLPVACGFTDPLPSPNGRKNLYLQTPPSFRSDSPWVLWLADANGHHPRRIGERGPPIGPDYKWPMPSSSVGRDCSYYSEPQCVTDVELKLQDAARGVAASVFRGEVHVLRLVDGKDSVVAYGSAARRFMNDGLVYADGARVRLVPWASLS
jgi:hypothetical protein